MPQEKAKNNSEQVAFRSGETAPISGIWRPAHERCPQAAEYWVRREDAFPPCPRCGGPANFTLLEQVDHISEDSDFQ